MSWDRNYARKLERERQRRLYLSTVSVEVLRQLWKDAPPEYRKLIEAAARVRGLMK